MPELRSQPVIRASVADYRPVTTGNGDDPTPHHKSDGQLPRGSVLRSRRNGLPETPFYEYGKSSYEWAVRVLEAAEAEYGAPPGHRGPGPRKNGATRARQPQQDARCPVCEYPLTSVGHQVECGGTR